MVENGEADSIHCWPWTLQHAFFTDTNALDPLIILCPIYSVNGFGYLMRNFMEPYSYIMQPIFDFEAHKKHGIGNTYRVYERSIKINSKRFIWYLLATMFLPTSISAASSPISDHRSPHKINRHPSCHSSLVSPSSITATYKYTPCHLLLFLVVLITTILPYTTMTHQVVVHPRSMFRLQ